MNRAMLEYAGVRALVLGGSGFIGRWVARRLVEVGADLTVAARDPARTRDVLARHGVRARILACPFAAEPDVEELLHRASPVIVFNLVGYGVDRGERDQTEMTRINRDLVRWITSTMADMPVAAWTGVRLVHTGSALEYGDVGGNLDEGVPGNPTEPYGRSKLAGTQALCDVAVRTGLRAITARLFTVYGEGEHEGRLLPSLMHAAESGESVSLSSGQQRRDFTWVGDVAGGLLRLGTSDVEPGTIVNLATGRISSVREFAEIAAQVLGLEPERLHFGEMPPRPEEMRHERVAVNTLRRITGWTPDTSIRDGVRLTREFQPATPHAAART